MPNPNIAIITGSTRPGRNVEAVAHWVTNIAQTRSDARFTLIDIADFALPLLDEPLSAVASARMGRDYVQQHSKAWSKTVSGFDGFVFVTPEYNFGIPAALKNALDYLHPEWNNKAAGFVSYGTNGGVRATAQLRQVLAELQIATVTPEVNLSLFTDFTNYTDFTPAESHEMPLSMMLDQLILWTNALIPARKAVHV